MRARRQFEPMVDALSYRMAPSGLIATPALSLLLRHETFATHTVSSSQTTILSKPLAVSHAAASPTSGVTMSATDTDMAETGTLGLILAGPPPTAGGRHSLVLSPAGVADGRTRDPDKLDCMILCWVDFLGQRSG